MTRNHQNALITALIGICPLWNVPASATRKRSIKIKGRRISNEY
jgi:hypothetical protein